MPTDLSDLLQPLRTPRVDAAFIELGAGSGVALAAARGAFLHLLVAGRGEIASSPETAQVALDAPGDYAVLLDARPHRLTTPDCRDVIPSDYFRTTHDLDGPPTLRFGTGRPGVRTLSARLRIDGSNPLVRSLPRTIAITRAGGGGGGLVPPEMVAGLHGPGGTTMVTALFDLLVLHAVRTATLPMFAAGAKRLPTRLGIARAMSLIDANLRRRWSLALLAAEVGVSRSTFAAEFMAQIGQTPMAYVTAQRMKRARESLRTPGVPVSEVAWRVGYDSPAAFTRTFKRMFGLTPAAFQAGDGRSRGTSSHRHLHWSAFLDDE